MVHLEGHHYIPPTEKFSQEVRLRPEVFEKLQTLNSENRTSVLDNYVMGQSLLEMSQVVSHLKKFTLQSFAIPEDRDDIVQPFYNYVFFETQVNSQGDREMNVLNTVDICLVNENEDRMYRFGVGIINMRRMGGFVNSHHGIEVPSHYDSVTQITDSGIELPLASENILPVDHNLLEMVNEYSKISLSDAYERYWATLYERNLLSSKNGTYHSIGELKKM